MMCDAFTIGSKMAQWTDETCLKLIDVYKTKPLLWDLRDRLHYNKSKKETAWKEIATAMEKPVEECRGKIASLQASYRREKNRERKADGDESPFPYVSRWYAFEALRFLDDGKKFRGVFNKKSDGAEQDQESEEAYFGNVSAYSPVEMEGLEFKREPDQSHDVTPEEDRGLKRSRDFDDKDQYEVFGVLVGMQIRDLPSAHAKKVAKHLISNILFKAEMGKFNDPSQEYDFFM